MKSNQMLLKNTKKIWRRQRVSGPIQVIKDIISALMIGVIPITNYMINHIWYVVNEEGLRAHIFWNFILGTLIYIVVGGLLLAIGCALGVRGSGLFYGFILAIIGFIGMLLYLYKTTDRHVIIYGVYVILASYGVLIAAGIFESFGIEGKISDEE